MRTSVLNSPLSSLCLSYINHKIIFLVQSLWCRFFICSLWLAQIWCCAIIWLVDWAISNFWLADRAISHFWLADRAINCFWLANGAIGELCLVSQCYFIYLVNLYKDLYSAYKKWYHTMQMTNDRPTHRQKGEQKNVDLFKLKLRGLC